MIREVGKSKNWLFSSNNLLTWVGTLRSRALDYTYENRITKQRVKHGGEQHQAELRHKNMEEKLILGST